MVDVVVLDPRVPVRVRRALNVESGLNDGLATPVVVVALGALAAATPSTDGVAEVASLDLPSGLLGVVVGIVLGVFMALAMNLTARHGASDLRARSLGVLVLPVLTFGMAELAHANVFLAAFMAGIAFGRLSDAVHDEPAVTEPLETASDIFGVIVWFFAGGLVVGVFENGFRLEWLVLAVLVLTVLRLIPVALALLGSGLAPPTRLFIGWFGPRGVATIVFGLLTVEALPRDQQALDIVGVFALTVLISVVAHGVSAGPLVARLARQGPGAAPGTGADLAPRATGGGDPQQPPH